MKPKNLLALALLLSLLLGVGEISGATGKPQPQVILDKMSCGVCGMYPARFPDWQTQIIFKDGLMVPFDGCKDMFKYLLNLAAYNKGQTRAAVAAIWVKSHDSGAWLDGETAYYVLGSSAMGPMGAELVPFAGAPAAKEFQSKNGGVVSRFSEITLEAVNKLGMGGMKMGGM